MKHVEPASKLKDEGVERWRVGRVDVKHHQVGASMYKLLE